jgi:hypothetical protein
MKQTVENITIKDISTFGTALAKQISGLKAVEYARETRTLILHLTENSSINEDIVRNLKIPTILRFHKKLSIIDIPNATPVSENEFQVETLDVEESRKKVKEKYPEFEEEK